jgi:hypothetical protein
MRLRALGRFLLVSIVTVFPFAVAPGVAAKQSSEPIAFDGATLSGQPSSTQATFNAAWGSKAAQEWASEHTHALVADSLATLGLKPSRFTAYPDMPPNPADTTVVPLHTSTAHAPVIGDLIDIDQQGHRMFLGNGGEDAIEVFDVSTPTPRWVTSFHVPGGVAGILYAPDLKRVYGGSPNGMVAVDADPNSPTYGTTLNTVFLGPGGTDELDYDPVDKKLYVTDVADQTVASVDAVKVTLIKSFTNLADTELEQPRYNPKDGFMYESWRATNQIAKFDPRSDTLVSITPIGTPCRPSGLAIKSTTGMALVGCRTALMMWDLNSNSMASRVDNAGGADAVIYNAKADRFFSAGSGFHRGPILSMLDGSGNFITNVPTTPISHEVAFDQTNNVVYTIGGGLIWFQTPR